MAGTFAYGVAAATTNDGRVVLFHIGSGRNVFRAYQSSPGSSFGSWVSIGGSNVTAIGASSVSNGDYEIYCITTSNSIFRQAPGSHTHGWQRISGVAARVAAARYPNV